jgi:methyl coenzyme M reductase subunit C
MTPDELPADMEGLIERVALPWIEAEEMSVDPEDLTKAGQAIRDLLKAYQKQRRALERIAITTLRDDGGAMRRLGQVVTEAQRALNQKGDER